MEIFNFDRIYQILIIVLSFSFLGLVLVSYYRNRTKLAFYQLLVREDKKPSKVGIAFVFIMILIVYQVVMGREVNSFLVELLAVIFGAELGTKGMDTWKTHLESKRCEKEMSASDMENL